MAHGRRNQKFSGPTKGTTIIQILLKKRILNVFNFLCVVTQDSSYLHIREKTKKKKDVIQEKMYDDKYIMKAY